MRITQSVVPLLVLLAGAAPTRDRPASRMTISGLHYIIDYPTNLDVDRPVNVWQGIDADVTVTGQFLDLSTGVDVVDRMTQLPASGISASIVSKQGGANTQIVVRVHTTSSVKLASGLADFDVRIHYVVETNGPDRFQVTVVRRGRIDSFSVDSGTPSDLTTRKGYTLRANGDVAGVRFPLSFPPFTTCVLSLDNLRSTATTSIYGILCKVPTQIQLVATNFLASQGVTSGSELQALCAVMCATGAGTVTLKFLADPTVTSLTPTTTSSGASITIAGTDLTPPGGTPTLRFLRKYVAPGQSAVQTMSLGGTNTALDFLAPQNIRPDSIFLDYPNAPLVRHPVPLPRLTVNEPPTVDHFTKSLAIGGTTYGVLVAGTDTVIGRNFSLISGLTTTTKGGTIGVSVTPTGGTTASFAGSSLGATASYQATLVQSDGTRGADRLVLSVADRPTTTFGSLTITAQGGSVTAQNVVFVKAPAPVTIKLLTSTGALQDIVGLALKRGSTYVLSGAALSVVAPAGTLQLGTVKLNGISLGAQANGSDPSGALRFTIPTTATSGLLTVETIGGVAPVGTFSVS